MGENSNLVTVNCPSHNQVLAIGLWRAFAGQHGVDIDISWNGRSVRAHRLIAELFLAPDKLKTLTEVPEDLPDASNSSLNALVEFLYSGTVVVARDKLDELLEVAKELDFRMLADAVESATEYHHQQTDPTTSDNDEGVQHYDYRANGAGSSRHSSELAPAGEFVVGAGPVPVECSVLLEEDDSDGDAIDWESADFEWERAGAKKPGARRSGSAACESIGLDSGDDCEMEAEAERNASVRVASGVARSAGQRSVKYISLRGNDGGGGPGIRISAGGQEPEAATKSPPERGWRVRVQGVTRVRAKSRGGGGESGSRVYRCQHCHFRTEKANSYYYHLRTVHCVTAKGKPASRFDCPMCDFTSLFRNQTAGHVRTKHGIDGWAAPPDDQGEQSLEPPAT